MDQPNWCQLPPFPIDGFKAPICFLPRHHHSKCDFIHQGFWDSHHSRFTMLATNGRRNTVYNIGEPIECGNTEPEIDKSDLYAHKNMHFFSLVRSRRLSLLLAEKRAVLNLSTSLSQRTKTLQRIFHFSALLWMPWRLTSNISSAEVPSSARGK